MSVYIARQVTKTARPTSAFSSRGITDLTQAKPSEITVFAKPQNEQLAYSGYKDSIEAFLYATAMGKGVLASAREYPIPDDYIPSFPLPLPQIILQLAEKNPSKTFRESFERAIAPLEGVRREMGKLSHVYILHKVTFSSLRGNLIKAASPTTPFLDHFASIHAGFWMARLLQCVDLFLRVQTYEYKGDSDIGPQGLEGYDAITREKRLWNHSDETLAAELPYKKRKIVRESGEVEEVEVEYSIEKKGAHVGIHDAVLFAKPSPKPSSINFGAPSEVPYKPGLFFPYFHGMIVGDTPHLRSLVSDLFFRNLSQPGVPLQRAWKDFRSDIGTIEGTSSGLALHHILLCLKLSLDAQARPFVVFTDGIYRGVCLLGDRYSVYTAGTEHVPVGAEELKRILQKVNSRRASAAIVAESIRRCKDAQGDLIEITDEEALKPVDLACALAKIDISESTEDFVDQVSANLAGLSLVPKYIVPSAKTIAEAIPDITSCFGDPSFTPAIPFYIPIKGWSDIDKPLYQVLARFGPSSISLRNSRGQDVTIPKTFSNKAESRLFVGADADSKVVLLVYEKPVRIAMQDWKDLVQRGTIRQDPGERAAGQRAYPFVKEDRAMIVGALMEMHKIKEFAQGKQGTSKGDAKDTGIGLKATYDFATEFSL